MVSPMSTTEKGVSYKIAQTSALTFVCYLIIGIQFATVPAFVAMHLGYGPLIAGAAVSVQYVATLLTRPLAGRMADDKGPKHATSFGLRLGLLGSVMMAGVAATAGARGASLALLVVCRLILGYGESLVATGATLWGLDRTGPKHMAQVLAWNGVASYAAIAIGSPLGAWLADISPYGVAASSIVAAGAGVIGARALEGTPPRRAPAAPLAGALRDALPYGVALALGGTGFGMISAFTTLYYAHQGWAGAGLALTFYGAALAAVRLTAVNTIHRYGGRRVAIVSLMTKAAGLTLIACAPAPLLAKIGAVVAGAGFSLVYPALGVETVRHTPPERRGAVLGVFTSFWDLSLGIAGPVGGVAVTLGGYRSAFTLAAVLILAAAAILRFRRDPGVATKTA